MSLSSLALSTAQVLESSDVLIYVSADAWGAGCGVLRGCLSANLFSIQRLSRDHGSTFVMLKCVSQHHALEAEGRINRAETTVARIRVRLCPHAWISADTKGVVEW